MPTIKYTPRRAAANHNVSKTSPLKSYLILSLGVTGVFLAIYMILGLFVSVLAPHMPASLEARLGAMFASYGEDAKNAEETARVQALLDSLVPLLEPDDRRLDYTAVVSDAPVVNALALPGGKIVVYSALVDVMEDDQELAFVLGHELGHFHNRDHLKRMGRGLVGISMAILIFGDESGATDFIFQRIQNLENKFSQSQEKAADVFGLDLVQKNTAIPKGLWLLWRKSFKGKKQASSPTISPAIPIPIPPCAPEGKP